MRKSVHISLILLGGVVALVATTVAYLSVYFTASQPENYGEFRFKVQAWICIAAIISELFFTIWLLIRAAIK